MLFAWCHDCKGWIDTPPQDSSPPPSACPSCGSTHVAWVRRDLPLAG